MAPTKVNKASKPAMIVVKSVAACVLILVIGGLGMAKLAGLKKPPAEAKVAERPLQIEARAVKPENVPVFITGYGEARALDVVSISPEVSGRIVVIHPRLEVGETVMKGDVLFRIDPRDYRAAQEEAQATEQQLKNTILRLEKQSAIDRQRCPLRSCHLNQHKLNTTIHQGKLVKVHSWRYAGFRGSQFSRMRIALLGQY